MSIRSFAISAFVASMATSVWGQTGSTLQSPSAAPSTASNKISVTSQVVLIHDIDIPAQSDGLLVELNIDDLSRVQKGSTLGVIDDRQALLTLKLKSAEESVANLEANNDVNVRNAIATEKVERAQAKSFQSLLRDNAAKLFEVEKEVLEADRALLSIELAKLQQTQAKGEAMAKSVERELAELEVARRQIISPIDGIIAEKFVQRGEWVQAGAKIARLISLDKLRIEGSIDTNLVTSQSVMNAPVDVAINITKTRQITIQGKVYFISAEIKPNSRNCTVRVEIDNVIEEGDYLIKPGMNATMTITPKTEVARSINKPTGLPGAPSIIGN